MLSIAINFFEKRLFMCKNIAST